MKRILIVDDSPIILASAKHALVASGYEVETRGSVEEVAARGADGFDLILMDVQMPELFGDDVAAVLVHERSVAGKVYLFSTLGDDELLERSTSAGLDGYISKRHGIEHLVAEVNKILG